MKHRTRRLLSLFLALSMCLSLVRPCAWAAEAEAVELEESVTEDETEVPAEVEASSDTEDATEEEVIAENEDVAEPEESTEEEDVAEVETPDDEEQSTVSDAPAIGGEDAVADEQTEEDPPGNEDAEKETVEDSVEEVSSEEQSSMDSNDPDIIDITEIDENQTVDSVFELPMDGAVGHTRLYKQNDYERWEYSLAHGGCILFSFANALYCLNGSQIDMGVLSEWAKKQDAWVPGEGGYRYKMYPAVQKEYGTKYGFKIGEVSNCNVSVDNNTLKNHLKNGGVAAAHISGHFIALVDYDYSKDQFFVVDSINWANNRLPSAGWVDSSYLQTHSGTIVDWFALISSVDTKPVAPTVKSWSSAWQDDTYHLLDITINWYAVNNATSYEIKWRRDDGSYDDNAAITVSNGKTTYTKKGLDPDHNYYFRVYAKNSAGTSSKSETINCCKRPTISSGTANSTSSITIKWGAVSNADSYTVRRKLSTEDDYTEIQSGIKGTSFTDNTVNAGTTYHYQVRAINDKGKSRYSSRVGVTTPSIPKYVLDVRCSLDGADSTVCGTFDLYINGNRVGDDITSYRTDDMTEGESFEINDVKAWDGYRITDPSIQWNGKYVSFFTSDGGNQNVRIGFATIVPTKHAIDLNRLLDGVEYWELAECGTADIWVNGTLVADDVSDYWAEWPEGYTYEVKDVKTRDGLQFDGIVGGSMSGVVGSTDVDLRLIFSTKKHAIDLNRLLDGQEHWELAECGTADIWVNGTLVADDVSDYWGEWPEGSTYEVTDVKTKTGYRFDGIQSNKMSGVVGGSDVDLRLMFSTVYYQLDLNGTRDSNYIWSLEDCATVDVYINGNLVADDVSDYCESLIEGTNFEFKDLKVKSGYNYEGIVEGVESGTLSGNTFVNYSFTTKYEATQGTQVIPDGWYMIVSGNDDDWVLDLNGWSGENGANLELYHRNNTTNQRFYLHYLNNGFYSIQVLHSGKYIQKQDADSFQSNVCQWDGCDSYSAQWKLAPTENGYFFIEARNGGCLDNVDGNITEGNNVRVFDFNGSNAQRWRFVSTSDSDGGEQLIPDGWYVIESGTDSGFALDVCGSSMEDGGTICLWNNDLSVKQIFHVEYQGDGYYVMRSKLNGKYIRTIAFDEWSTDGWCEDVAQWDGIDKHSKWCLESAGDDYYYVRFENGNYLDHYGSSAYPLSTVIAWMFNGGQTQKWKFTPYDDSMLQSGLTSHYMGHTYEVFYQARTWSEADAICRARGGHLATITSEAENQFLTDCLLSECTYWLGGTDRDSEGNFIWTTGEDFSYSNWNNGEPNNTQGIENFVSILGSGRWNDEPEDYLRDFICEYDPAPPIKTASYQNHVYELYNTPMTWDEARRFCESKGGHLVTITSQGENNAVSELVLSDPDDQSYWIAANDMDQDGTFVWITGEAFQYSNWADGEPNNINNKENVADISKTGTWYDTNENITIPFVCEYDPDKTNIDSCEITLSKTSFTYDGNAKAPAVTVKHNNDVLTEGVHYIVSYQNNINTGTATVTISGKGDYVGSMEKLFTITKPAEPEPQPIDPDVVFQVGSSTGSPGAEVTIPVSLTKNSGIAGFTLDAVYDHSVLTLKNATAAEGVGGMFSSNGDLVNWYADENVISMGTLFNLTFVISGTAASGDTEISLAMHSGMPNVVDENSDNVTTEFTTGAVTVRSYVAGDVTGDGLVTIADVVKINRHVIGKILLDGSALLAADLNGDSNVTIADVVKVNRYVIGKITSLDVAPKRALTRSSAKPAVGAVISVDAPTVNPGVIAEIPIRISGNPGFAGFAFELSLPDEVKLNSVKAGSILSGGVPTTNGNVISWYDAQGENAIGDDILLTLNVTAPQKTGDYTIGIALKDGIASNLANENSEPVTACFEVGTLHVESSECEHDWGEGTETTAATCTTDGVKKFTCSKCSDTKTETIPALGHSYSAAVTPPTCRDQGFTTHTCERCGDHYEDSYTDIVDHDYHGTVVTPTCTTEGYTKYVCSFCDDTYYDNFVEELDHDYNDGVVTTAATENTDGEILYTCQRCGHTETEVIPAFSHVFGDGVVTREPTCTEDGVLTYTCTGCGETFTESIDALGHDYANTVTAPTCTERGYTTHTCGKCNNSYQDTYTNALGHSWNSGVITKTATVSEEGVKTFTCTRCNATRTETIPMRSKVTLKAENVTVANSTFVYNGKAQQPAVSVKYSGKTLVKGTDFTVSYSNNTNAGTATVTVTGKGNYAGSIAKTFTIAKATQTVTVTAPATVIKGKKTSVIATGFGTISYTSSNTKIATVTAKGVVKGIAPGTVTLTVKAAGNANYNAASTTVKITVNLPTPNVTKVENVNGGVKITVGKVTDAAKYRLFYKTGKGKWTKLTDITSTTNTWKKAKSGTTYAFTVRCVSQDGKSYTSNYNKTGKSILYLSVPTLVNSTAKTMKVTWKRASGVTGYQVSYATSSKFSGAKTVTVKNAKTLTTHIKNLKKGTTYYVRFRTFTTKSGKTTYSAWSGVKSIKLSK